ADGELGRLFRQSRNGPQTTHDAHHGFVSDGVEQLPPKTPRERLRPADRHPETIVRGYCCAVTVRHDWIVTPRMTKVITRPMLGSAPGAPSATAAALARTPRLTKPSTRAWLPSATRAGLARRLPARRRICAAISFPANPIAPAAASHQRWVSVCGWKKRR